MDQIQLKAMAKINLGLDVIGKREDGYHELRMVMQMINLYDKISITVSREPGIRLTTNLPFLPVNENNIVCKAAKLIIDEFHLDKGVDIILEKHIPVAAGMAGGSSDGACVLYGMNKLFGLGLSKKELMTRGVRLGADVPYCILRTTALSEGIGEILTTLPPMPKCHILVAKPGISVSTKAVFGKLNVNDIRHHPDIDGIVSAIRENNLYQIAKKMENTLESVTIRDYPVIDTIKQTMAANGALGALMSGSGPTVFGLYDDEKKAKDAYCVLKQGNLAKQVFLTRPVN
ncbi:MAG: 4-(cytidine 5'-diphospho)-2-C-methyl-D-erythritol kinase [Clostridiales bacterium]|nr:4-(cytidine 5'-diphospho)-2-C-methyl-D-erythritol kinase [Clostridiales bacterium]MDY3746510.1 4-(cytidine 5'-diphospho)-2-C-methyl-D-erythritol kinase [Lachnospiraceae bacterium]